MPYYILDYKVWNNLYAATWYPSDSVRVLYLNLKGIDYANLQCRKQASKWLNIFLQEGVSAKSLFDLDYRFVECDMYINDTDPKFKKAIQDLKDLLTRGPTNSMGSTSALAARGQTLTSYTNTKKFSSAVKAFGGVTIDDEWDRAIFEGNMIALWTDVIYEGRELIIEEMKKSRFLDVVSLIAKFNNQCAQKEAVIDEKDAMIAELQAQLSRRF
ncbi:hypothetical protein BDB01DRAFT_904936 [Pilobolus umbonatus]|nr:hypothetical protein BDB01DRAFT_904936 [Pilobolus umbonatus]